jgi:glycosyltransferase involved in cell wall biosynthesis
MHFSISGCARAIYNQYRVAAPEAVVDTSSDKNLLIVIPARNEAATIGDLLCRLNAEGWRDVLVINDQSTDDTQAIASAAGAQVLSPALPVGAWGGMQLGIRYALRHGYQAVITMDADGQHEVDEIPTLLQARQQADLVVGAFPERASSSRQLAWNWFRHLAGFDLRDLTSGFRLYNRQVLEVLASREATLLDYQDLGALLLVRRAGLKITEIPVNMKMRTVGKSRIFNSWLNVAKYMLTTSLLCLARWDLRSRSTP